MRGPRVASALLLRILLLLSPVTHSSQSVCIHPDQDSRLPFRGHRQPFVASTRKSKGCFLGLPGAGVGGALIDHLHLRVHDWLSPVCHSLYAHVPTAAAKVSSSEKQKPSHWLLVGLGLTAPKCRRVTFLLLCTRSCIFLDCISMCPGGDTMWRQHLQATSPEHKMPSAPHLNPEWMGLKPTPRWLQGRGRQAG